ncbi:hypothetical protein PR003_g10045 [Phytophthora rubi]|uniref:HTH CENPB-type domain-containing protein n=1 Tax=Phytophthora rubi TaxID=129364 RepID=A0A6A4FSE5_9STRA|nr:hypothetical protein PR002_g9823 [Phytophthora rubi]KAE9034453.1 hypothetical protein PR001_g9722 [Phytophthora rubi]KAE9341313.1 hypothetical protein PR003_g10045 [Phytophthora rubi]
MLTLQAQEIYQGSGGRPGAFKASWSWRNSYLRRHRLSIHRRTRVGQTTLADSDIKAYEFSKKVPQKIQALGVSVVYNADQTGVNYEYVPTTAIGNRGQKTVWVKCSGKTKARVTAMLLAGSDGSKQEPFLVLKTRP